MSFVILFFLVTPFNCVCAGEISLNEIPDWVAHQDVKMVVEVPEAQISDGVYYLLLDRQTWVGRNHTDQFNRVLKKVLTPQGVENASQININFDPSYEKISLHSVLVHRDRQTVNQLDLNSISVFQRESDLERRLYNGQKTVSIILEDTRPGDTIEYAYSRSGQNPVFKGRYLFEGDTAWAVPLGMLHYRWIFSNGYPVTHKTRDCRRSLLKKKIPDGVEYSYTDKDIAAILVDENLPHWYSPYPIIQISQFKDWADVAEWGTALYETPENISPILQNQIDGLKKCTTNKETIAKALCLVQNDIRYLGIEIGAGSYQPTPPDVTYKRKFGDCKDKSILFSTMLNKLGVQATPALVNTRLEEAIDDYLPSPLAFNHVIVQVADEGKTYWIDPTSDCQGVPLDEQYQALYGKALVLEKGAQFLSDTGEDVLSEPAREVYEEFDLTDGMSEPALLTIKTIFRGREADRVRYQIKSSSLQKTAKSYLNFYALDYPTIAERQSLHVEDTFEANQLVIKEYYRIPDIWQASKDKDEHTVSFHCTEFSDLFQKPKTTIRSMPIGLPHPRHITQRTIVKLPEHWDIKNEHGQVENSALRFTYDIAYSENILTLNYSYLTKRDFVTAEQTAEFIADLDKIKDQIGYWLSWGKENKGQALDLSWFFVGAALLGSVAAIVLSFLVWRMDPLPMLNTSHELDKSGLKGIGGWLVMVMLGLFVSPVVTLMELAELLPTFKLNYWLNVEEWVRPGFETAYKILVGSEVAVNIILMALLFMLLYLFFAKRTVFPKLFIAVTIGDLLFALLDLFLYGYMTDQELLSPEAYRQMIGGTIGAVIWCMYMLKSVRVRQTFIVRRHRPSTTSKGGALGSVEPAT